MSVLATTTRAGLMGPGHLRRIIDRQSRFITVSGPWTCPADVTRIYICVAGGGQGANTNGASSQGGRAGVTVIGYLDVIPGTTYDITIGAGGAFSATASLNPGSDTKFSLAGTDLVRAIGGGSAGSNVVPANGAVLTGGNFSFGTGNASAGAASARLSQFGNGGGFWTSGAGVAGAIEIAY